MSCTNAKITASIREEIEYGSYNVGVPVVNAETSKLAINNEGKVVQKKIDVQARKIPFFGLYFHSCVTHSSQLLQAASCRSINAEMFEKLFEKLPDIMKTWSKRIEDIPRNTALTSRESTDSDCVLKEEKATHLELIPGFLKPGEGVWWKEMEDHVDFFDGPEEANFRHEGPNLHHFHSSSINTKQELLKIGWEKCLQDKVKIPATKMRGETGEWERSLTCCLVQWTADATDDENNGDETQMKAFGSDVEKEDSSD